jgi:hypothetical protein
MNGCWQSARPPLRPRWVSMANDRRLPVRTSLPGIDQSRQHFIGMDARRMGRSDGLGGK